jgi:membrane protein
MLKALSTGIKIFKLSFHRLFFENYMDRASALAFTTILALVPLLSVIVSFIAWFPIFTRFMTLARNYILTNFIPTSSSTIDYYLESFINQATKLPTMGLLFLLVTVIALIITVETSLNEIWHAPKKEIKISSWIINLTLLFISPILIGLSSFLTSYLFSISWVSGTTDTLRITAPLLAMLPILVNTVMFSALYVIAPNCRVRWNDGFFGGFVAAILFEIARVGFAFYIKKFPSYELIYGTFATIPIFLLWIYISWLIILYGALVLNTKYNYSRQSQ